MIPSAVPQPAPSRDPRQPRLCRFEIHYRNSQGTLMRLLTTVSRRGLDFEQVRAEPLAGGSASGGADLYRLVIALRAHSKHIAQMCRDWRSIVDIVEVRQPVELESETSVSN